MTKKQKHDLNSHSIFSKIAYRFILLLFVSMLFIALFYCGYTSKIILEKSTISQVNYIKTLDSNFTGLINYIKENYYFNDLFKAINKINNIENKYDIYQESNSFLSKLKDIIETQSEMTDILFIGPTRTISTNNKLNSIEYSDFSKSLAYSIDYNNETIRYISKDMLEIELYDKYFADKLIISRKITDDNNNQLEGFLLFLIEPNAIIYDNYDSFFKIQSTNSILYSNNENYNYFETFNKDFFSYENIKTKINFINAQSEVMYYSTDTKLYFLIRSQLHNLPNLSNFLFRIVLIFIISFLLGIFLTILPLKLLAKPLIILEHNISLATNSDPWSSANIKAAKHKNLLGNIEFKRQLIIIGFCSVLIPNIILSLNLYFSSKDSVSLSVKNSISNCVEQSSKNIDYYTNLFEKANLYLVTNENVQLYFYNKDMYHFNTYTNEDYIYILEMLKNFYTLYEGLKNVKFYDQKGNELLSTFYGKSEKIQNSSELLQAYINDGKVFWSQSSEDLQGEYVFSLIRKVRNIEVLDTLYSFKGYVQFDIQESFFQNKYEYLQWEDNGYNFLIFENTIISSNNSKNLEQILEIIRTSNSDFSSGQFIYGDLLITLSNSTHNGWQLVNISSINLILKEINSLIFFTALIISFVTILIIVTVSNISINIAQMFKGLVSSINAYPAKSNNRSYKKTYNNELLELSNQFNKMIYRINKLINEVELHARKEAELEKRKNEAELLAYQSQINPHFLYNTFLSISFLIKSGDTKSGHTMIKQLSQLFHNSIYTKSTIIKLKDEVGYAKSYLNIQQMRFEELEAIWKIDKNALDSYIVKFTLQPIIENSLYHGLELKTEKGTILIYCKLLDRHLKIIILDNGIGISKDTIKALKEKINSEVQPLKGIGLWNVNQRLKIYYGDNYQFEIYSRINKGTYVLLKIPRIDNT